MGSRRTTSKRRKRELLQRARTDKGSARLALMDTRLGSILVRLSGCKTEGVDDV